MLGMANAAIDGATHKHHCFKTMKLNSIPDQIDIFKLLLTDLFSTYYYAFNYHFILPSS